VITFTERPEYCPKCGIITISPIIQWYSSQEQDYLITECRQCGYYWYEKPLDAIEEKVNGVGKGGARTGDEVTCPKCNREYQRSLKGIHEIMYHGEKED
jgi:Zn ribbon nucleic-acid-binding protein